MIGIVMNSWSCVVVHAELCVNCAFTCAFQYGIPATVHVMIKCFPFPSNHLDPSYADATVARYLVDAVEVFEAKELV